MSEVNDINTASITAQQNVDKTQGDRGDISIAQAADGALDIMHDNLQRIRDLAVQAANATISDAERQALQSEVNQLIAEINQTSGRANSNAAND